MSNQLTAQQKGPDANAIEKALLQGDLGALNENQRLSYYHQVCESLGLNPLTKPFEYIKLNGKLTLYAKRDCTDQLRKVHNVSVSIVSRERVDELLVVTARASLASGRIDESVGAVTVLNLKGENLANAMMKAETKAKRRVTLSICGLAMLDESEVGSVAQALHIEPAAAPKILSKPAIAAVPAEAPKPMPIEFAPAIVGETFPWDIKYPASEAQAPVEAPTDSLEDLGSYVIKDGKLKGVAFKDKPDAFWNQYRKDLDKNLQNPDFPEQFRTTATEVYEALGIYLAGRK